MTKRVEKSTKKATKAKVQKTTKDKPIKDTTVKEMTLVILPEDIKLLPREELFVDEYMKDYNATQAYARSYKKCKEHVKIVDAIYNTCAVEGNRLLKKPNIKKVIDERKELLKSDAIADANEVWEFFSEVMRGEVKDQLGFETSVRDRLKAAETLKRRYEALNNITEPSDKEETAKEIKLTVVDNSSLEAALYDAAKKDSKIETKTKGSVKNGRIK